MDTLLRILNSRSASLEKFAYYVWEASLEDTSGLVNFVNKLTEDMDVWSSWRYGGLNGRLRDWAMEAIVTYDDTGNLFGEFVKDHWSGEASTIAGKVYGTKGKAELMYGLLGSTFIKDYTTHAGDYASSWGAILGSVHLSTAFDIPGIVSILPGGILHPTDVPESIITSINGDFRMNLSEHHLYGSSRLGIKNYHSAQYQVVYSDTGSEIYSWQGLGGRKPWYSLVYAENISSLGTEPYGMAETNAYSVSHQIGRKQYELSNHLGNVQATVSDHRYTLYREEGNSWVVDRYHPVLSSAYDYYPFGMLMPDRYVSDTTSYCQTISQTKWMKKLTEICWTVSAPSSWPTIVTEGSASTTVSVSSVEIDIPAPSSTEEFSVSVTPAEENDLVLTASMVSGVGIVEVYEIIGGNEYVLASTPVTASQQHTVTKITFTPTTSEVKVKYKYGTSGWTWHGHSICITKPIMVSETYYVDVCDSVGDKYRFGFNTQEKVNEISGIGNHNTAEFWEYDTRLGRRWNLDPKPNTSLSNYSTFAGNPILNSDPLGDTVRVGTQTDESKKYLDGNTYTKKELQENLLKDWSRLSGLNLSIDENGVMHNNGEIKGAKYSPTARKYIADAISDKGDILVDWSILNSSTINAYSADYTSIKLNPGEIYANIKGTSSDLDPMTFGLGMTVIHEMGHSYLDNRFGHSMETMQSFGVIDQTDYRTNKIRSEMGRNWGQRLSYTFIYHKGYNYTPMTQKSFRIMQRIANQLKLAKSEKEWNEILDKSIMPSKGVIKSKQE